MRDLTIKGIGSVFDMYGARLSGETEYGAALPRTSYVSVPGRSGSVDMTESSGQVVYDDAEDALVFSFLGERDVARAEHMVSDLSGRRLEYMESGSSHWSDGRWEVDSVDVRGGVAAVVTVRVVRRPFRVSDAMSKPVSGRTAVNLRGVMPSYPVFNLKATGGDVSIERDDGVRLLLDSQADSGATVVVDMEGQKATINGNLVAVDLSSDFFPLLPGVNYVTVNNASGTVTWKEGVL